MTDWMKNITRNDLPTQYHDIVDIIGVENTLKLAERYPKQPFYFVGLEKTIKKKKREFIIENFTGDNHKELARATGYSMQWVYVILKNCKDEKQPDLYESKNE